MVDVLDKLPSDFPMQVKWQQFFFLMGMFILCGGFATVVTTILGPLVLLVAFLPSLCKLLRKGKRALWGRTLTTDTAADDQDDPGVPHTSVWTHRYEALLRYLPDDLFAMSIVIACMMYTVVYFHYSDFMKNGSISPMESMASFYAYVILMLVQACKQQATHNHEVGDRELCLMFQGEDIALRHSMGTDRAGVADRAYQVPPRVKAEACIKAIRTRWAQKENGAAALLDSEVQGLIKFMDDPHLYQDTNHFWDAMRVFYPTVFDDPFAEGIISTVQKARERALSAEGAAEERQPLVDGGQRTLVDSSGAKPRLKKSVTTAETKEWSVAQYFEGFDVRPKMIDPFLAKPIQARPWFVWLWDQSKCILVSMVHALIPPVWMAYKHPGPFYEEIWHFRHPNENATSHNWRLEIPLSQACPLGPLWTPEFWVLSMVIVSIISQFIAFYTFINHINTLTINYRKYLKRLIVFRATSEFGYSSLSHEEEKCLSDMQGWDPLAIRSLVVLSNTTLLASTKQCAADVYGDLQSKQTKLDDPEAFLLLPYHLMPANFFRPLGVCIWWKVRHCIKVSIAKKKVDLEIMISLIFVGLLTLVFGSVLFIMYHSHFTVLSWLCLWDVIVLNAYAVSAINACVYLGEFLKSDAALLSMVRNQIEVSITFQGGRESERIDRETRGSVSTPLEQEQDAKMFELKMCNSLLQFFQQRIETLEKGPELFGYALTPDVRNKLVTFGGIGMFGTVIKAFRHYMKKIFNEAAEEELELESEQDNATVAHADDGKKKKKKGDTHGDDKPEKAAVERSLFPSFFYVRAAAASRATTLCASRFFLVVSAASRSPLLCH